MESEEATRKARGAPTVVSVRLSAEALVRVDAEARRRGVSRSALIEALAVDLPPAGAD